MLLELSHARNSIPLTSMTDVTRRDGTGLKLPIEQETLLQPNLRVQKRLLKISWRVTAYQQVPTRRLPMPTRPAPTSTLKALPLS